jgi:hypothetical protein
MKNHPYPLSLIAGLAPGQHEIPLGEHETITLRGVAAMLLKSTGKNHFGISANALSDYAKVLIAIPSDLWPEIPAVEMLTARLVREAVNRVRNGESITMKVDNEADYNRLRVYVYRSGKTASLVKNDGFVQILPEKPERKICEFETLDDVGKGMRQGVETFYVKGKSNYIRTRVSVLNKELGTTYKVRAIDATNFAITCQKIARPRIDDDLAKAYKSIRKFELERSFDSFEAVQRAVTALKKYIIEV